MTGFWAAALALLLSGAAAQHPETLLDHFWRIGAAEAEPSSEVLFFRADVDGDGRPELFLGLSSSCGTGGCGWDVYAPAGPGRVRYLGQAGFAVHAFRLDVQRHALVSCWHMNAEHCSLGEYRFAGGRMRLVNLGDCRSEEASCERALAAIKAWDRRYGSPVLGAAVDSLDAPGAWHDERGASTRRPPELDYRLVADMLPTGRRHSAARAFPAVRNCRGRPGRSVRSF